MCVDTMQLLLFKTPKFCVHVVHTDWTGLGMLTRVPMLTVVCNIHPPSLVTHLPPTSFHIAHLTSLHLPFSLYYGHTIMN